MKKRIYSTNNEDKQYHKAIDHCHYTGKYREAARNVSNLRYKAPEGIPLVFHSSSKYDFRFIIKELAKEFEGQFECHRENTKMYITFPLPLKKVLKNSKIITYKLSLLIALGLCQAHCQALLIIFLKRLTIINSQIVSLVLNTYWPKIDYQYLIV